MIYRFETTFNILSVFRIILLVDLKELKVDWIQNLKQTHNVSRIIQQLKINMWNDKQKWMWPKSNPTRTQMTQDLNYQKPKLPPKGQNPAQMTEARHGLWFTASNKHYIYLLPKQWPVQADTNSRIMHSACWIWLQMHSNSALVGDASMGGT